MASCRPSAAVHAAAIAELPELPGRPDAGSPFTGFGAFLVRRRGSPTWSAAELADQAGRRRLAVGNARKLFSLRTFHSVSLAFFAATRARRPDAAPGPFEKDRGEIKPSCAISHWMAPPATQHWGPTETGPVLSPYTSVTRVPAGDFSIEAIARDLSRGRSCSRYHV